jgi:hypothetical protein
MAPAGLDVDYYFMNADKHKPKDFGDVDREERIKHIEGKMASMANCHKCAAIREKLLGAYTAIREHLLHQKDKP